jgi:regulator of sigma E protease
MDFLIKTGQLILSLSILIVLHEMGHFAPARWFKTRVEKFYLFFDFPPFNSLWSIKKGETEYGIGWLPLGGYVKIAGMIDESQDSEALKQPMQPWEFRAKPAWQRLIIMIGGVTVNFLLGIFLFAMVLFFWGKNYIPSTEMKNGMAFDAVLVNQGFQQGDLVTKIGAIPFDRFEPGLFWEKAVFGSERAITIIRNGQEQVIQLSNDIDRQVTDLGMSKNVIMSPRIPFDVAKVSPGSPAFKAGIEAKDRIFKFNGEVLSFYDQFAPKAMEFKGKEVELGILRNGDTIYLKPTLTEEGTLGVQTNLMPKEFKLTNQKYGFFESIPAGYHDAIDFLSTQISAFGKMLSGKINPNKSLGSFISIGSMFSGTEDFNWHDFWVITASLSLILAFMNLLPIPALDGGYVLFLIWEVVTGRRVSDEFMGKAVYFGFLLLMGLMLYAFGLDIWRNIISRFIH